MKSQNTERREAFHLALPPVLLLGLTLAGLFFGLIITGPLDWQLLRRYCLSHPVAITSVSLFFVGIVTLSMKWYQSSKQLYATRSCTSTLRRLLADGQEITPGKRPEWLAAHWYALPANLQQAWFGSRLMQIIEMQISRGRRHQLEVDLRNIADADADRQHDSYSLLRIINWAMPMLGFLGTVLGISQTLGQLDTKMLATQQQEAMNQLTAGLYVAFDTTAIALVLTVFLMFVQFGISRLELRVLGIIDREIEQGLIGYLTADPFDAHDSLLHPIREMATELVEAVHDLTEKQAFIWGKSIAESQSQWANWTNKASKQIESQLTSQISESLAMHVEGLKKLQDEEYQQVDLRFKQWLTTLSDQARTVQSQQKEIIEQTNTLKQLVDSTSDLRKLEDTIHDSVVRLESVSRIEEASMCIGEAVAVLATSMERAGVIRGTPVKPRATKGSPDLPAEATEEPNPQGETRSGKAA